MDFFRNVPIIAASMSALYMGYAVFKSFRSEEKKEEKPTMEYYQIEYEPRYELLKAQLVYKKALMKSIGLMEQRLQRLECLGRPDYNINYSEVQRNMLHYKKHQVLAIEMDHFLGH